MVHEDIKAYVHKQIYDDKDSELQRWHSHKDVQSEIEDKLMGKANGMYVAQIVTLLKITQIES